MIKYELNEVKSILHVQPQGALQAEDFKILTKTVDPVILEKGNLKGIIIETEHFPGWSDFSAFRAHLSFVKAHHKNISKIALVSNSSLATLGEKLAALFLKPTIKKFPFEQLENAKLWIES